MGYFYIVILLYKKKQNETRKIQLLGKPTTSKISNVWIFANPD